jgi:hypothetical protein
MIAVIFVPPPGPSPKARGTYARPLYGRPAVRLYNHPVIAGLTRKGCPLPVIAA